jgi:type 1 glutamine amidotransferase
MPTNPAVHHPAPDPTPRLRPPRRSRSPWYHAPMLTYTLAALAATAVLASDPAEPAPPIKTRIITGFSNHNWQYTSRVHKDTLEGCGRFQVDITDDPKTFLADAGKLSAYKLLVLDYNDSQAKSPQRWGDAAEKNFASAVRGGVGVVAIHSSNNAFIGWKDYEQMMGLVWVNGQTGHGKYHQFKVDIADKGHPITKGLSDFTTTDELYHNLVNTQNAKFSVLAKAFDAKEIGGTEKDEPMAIVHEFGAGRVFATALGHVWGGPDDPKTSVTNPGFRALLVRGGEWAATGAVTLPAEWADVQTHNTLTAAEKSAGWTLLFDGSSAAGLKGYKQDKMPDKGWTVTDGILRHLPGAGGGDICTVSEYGDFEFACDWRCTPGANSGIIYRATEDHDNCWETGREMQILDNDKHNDGRKPKTRAGTMYDLFPTAAEVCRPAGEWNHAKVVCKGTHIEHWLNGIKVVEIDTAADAYKQALAASKFTSMPDFGTRMKGHICLQDHGDEVWFRDIKVRDLK